MVFHDIDTPRLRLTGVCLSDRDFLFREFTDDDVNRYLYDAEPFESADDAEALIRFYTESLPKIQHRWILTHRDTGEKIGTCGFHVWLQEDRSVEIGYDMPKAYWGKGYMTEAVRAILDFARDEMGVTRVDAHIADQNARSIRLAERVGFVFSGQTETLLFRGQEYPHRVYTLLIDHS